MLERERKLFPKGDDWQKLGGATPPNRNLHNKSISFSPSSWISLFSFRPEMHGLPKVTDTRIHPPPRPRLFSYSHNSCFFLCGVFKFLFLILCFLFFSSPLPKWVPSSWVVLRGGVWVLADPPPGPSVNTTPDVFAIQRLSFNFLCAEQKKILNPKWWCFGRVCILQNGKRLQKFPPLCLGGLPFEVNVEFYLGVDF